MEIDESEVVIEGKIIGADQLAKKPLDADLSTTILHDLKKMLLEAVRSSQLCV
jgi:hypothetical protein